MTPINLFKEKDIVHASAERWEAETRSTSSWRSPLTIAIEPLENDEQRM